MPWSKANPRSTIADLDERDRYSQMPPKRGNPWSSQKHGFSVTFSPEAFAAITAAEYGAVAVGGGPLMSSIPWCTHLLELFAAAKQAGMKCLIAGCGIGSLYVDYRNAAIKHLLEIADEVVLRDRASAEVARKVLGVERKCAVALDPAFV